MADDSSSAPGRPTRQPYKLAFLASHGGSNMQAILDACARDDLASEPCVVISNNPQATALERAAKAHVPALCLNTKRCGGEEAVDEAICAALEEHGAEIVILAGYMRKIGPRTLGRFADRMLNIHPALLPKHGGKGMYGMRVHEAVIAAGDKESGVTVHLINDEYDQGRTLAQRTVPVEPSDDAESLAKRVLAVEHQLYWQTISAIERGEIEF